MIKTISITQLPNPMHVQFMDSVVTLVSDKNPTSLNVKPQFDFFCQKVTELKDLYKSVQVSPLTEQITEAGIWRDRILTGMLKVVEGCTFHFDPTVMSAAILLQKNFPVYGNEIVPNDFQTVTVKIESIISDWCTKPELMSAMNTLAMRPWITELETANNEFKRFYALRTEEISHKAIENMFTKRTEANVAYFELCKFINSYSVINCTNPVFETVITGINTCVDQFSTLLKQRTHKPIVSPQEN